MITFDHLQENVRLESYIQNDVEEIMRFSIFQLQMNQQNQNSLEQEFSSCDFEAVIVAIQFHQLSLIQLYNRESINS